MSSLISPLAILASAAALAACAPVPQSPQPQSSASLDGKPGVTTVEVTAAYRERILLSPGDVLVVKVEDVSRADAAARVIVRHREPLNRRPPPYWTHVDVPTSRIDPRHRYSVRVEILSRSGAPRFVTDTNYPVLTHGAENRTDVVLRAVEYSRPR